MTATDQNNDGKFRNAIDPDIFHEPAVCDACGQAFQRAFVPNLFNPSKRIYTAAACQTCQDAIRHRLEVEQSKRLSAERLARKTTAWERICPLEFRILSEGGPTDVNLLIKTQPKAEAVISTPWGSTGVILRGPTRSCKTRIMYRLLRRHFDAGKRIEAVTSGQFHLRCLDAAGQFRISDLVERWSTVEALFIDDLGKGQWTSTTCGHFFEVIDARYRARLPTFYTTNVDGENLIKTLKLGEDLGGPILGRIRETTKGFVLEGRQ